MSLRFILIIYALSYSVMSGQKASMNFVADSIIIYKHFKNHGTTGRLWKNHRYLDSIKAPANKMSSTELKELLELFSGVKKKRLFQQKYGGDICHAIAYKGGQRIRLAIFCSGNIGFIDDLDHMHRWILKDPAKCKDFETLIMKIWL